MNERTIFLQSLEKRTAAERAAFLAEACNTDATLRRRVDELLQSHSAAGSFLGKPAVAPDAATPTSGSDTQGACVSDNADDITLDFLDPPTKPDSLGRLDHYEVLGVVGRGGMGIVLRAFDEKLHRVVALKVMTRDIAGSAAARKRFSREAKAAAAVVHDHIVPIHSIEESGPTPYLVMQFIDGQSLQQKIDAEGSLELKEILRIGLQIACGLAAAHRQGLVHRDIKPSNILLENGVQRVKITDFGLARAVDDASVSQSGIIAGTPQYMSPEQADGRPVDHRSDLFSLGSVLYAMCTGRPPFRAAGAVATLKRVCEDTPRPIRELNPDMPDWLGDIATRLHTKATAERFPSAQELSELLEQHLAHVQQPGQVPLPGPKSVPMAKDQAFADAIRRIREKPPLLLFNLAILSLIFVFVFVARLANHTPDDQAFQFLAPGAALGFALIWIVLLRFAIARWRGPTTTRPKLSRRQRVVQVGLILVAATAAVWWWFSDGPVIPSGRLEIGTGDPDMMVTLDGKLVQLKPISHGTAPQSGWRSTSTGIVVSTGPHQVQALRDGQVIFDKVVEIADGQTSRVVIPRIPVVDTVELQRLVTLQETAVDKTRRQTEVGAAPVAELTAAQIELIEARVRLAEALRKPQEVDRLLRELVEKREELWHQAKALVLAGAIAQTEMDQAEKRLIEARIRAGLREPPTISSGLKAIEGRWIAISAEYQGKPVPEAEAKNMFASELVFRGDQYGITWGSLQHEGALTIDATKTPAEMNFSGSIFADLKPRQAIYKLDGDRLTLCLPFGPNADPPRPTDFTTGAQSKNAVLTYRRAK